MSKILLVLLLYSPLASLAQQKDTLYTLPLVTARKLVADAMRARVLDTINQELNLRVYNANKALSGLQIDMGEVKRNCESRIEGFQDSYRILTTENKDLQKSVSKSKNQVKGWKIGTVVAFGVGLYLGIQAGKD